MRHIYLLIVTVSLAHGYYIDQTVPAWTHPIIRTAISLFSVPKNDLIIYGVHESEDYVLHEYPNTSAYAIYFNNTPFIVLNLDSYIFSSTYNSDFAAYIEENHIRLADVMPYLKTLKYIAKKKLGKQKTIYKHVQKQLATLTIFHEFAHLDHKDHTRILSPDYSAGYQRKIEQEADLSALQAMHRGNYSSFFHLMNTHPAFIQPFLPYTDNSLLLINR